MSVKYLILTESALWLIVTFSSLIPSKEIIAVQAILTLQSHERGGFNIKIQSSYFIET